MKDEQNNKQRENGWRSQIMAEGKIRNGRKREKNESGSRVEKVVRRERNRRRRELQYFYHSE